MSMEQKIEEIPFEEVYEVEKYGTYYSEKRFWKKIKNVAKKLGATTSGFSTLLYVAK